MTNEFTFFIYFIFPLFGFVIGSIQNLRFINNRQSLKILLIVSLLTCFSFITSISFSLDIIDKVIISIGLTSIGYCGTKIKDDNSGLNKNTIHLFRVFIILIYVSLPFILVGMFFLAFANDTIGKTVHIDEDNKFKIKHENINSNFTFSGYHNVYVFQKRFIVEYQVDKFELGEYGQYGFNGYRILNNGTKIPLNKFVYNIDLKKLILYSYSENKYTISKEFKNNP